MIKIINKIFLSLPPRIESFFLPSYLFLWAFALLLLQISSIKAMDEDFFPLRNKNSEISVKLEKLKEHISSNLEEFDEKHLEKCKEELKCSNCDTNPCPHGMPHSELLLPSDQLIPLTGGYSGNKVYQVFRNGQNILFVKEFENEKEWAKEVWNSLAGEVEIKQSAPKLNVITTLDASNCGRSSIIVTKAIKGVMVWDCLLTNNLKSSKPKIRAVGKFLGKLAWHTRLLLNEEEKIKTCRAHAAELIPTLVAPSPQQEKIPLFPLLPLFLSSIVPQKRTPEAITARNVRGWLSMEDQDLFYYSLIKICQQYIENFHQAFKRNKELQTELVHGDANFKNMIYDDSPDLVDQNGSKIPEDSDERITLIDLVMLGRRWVNGADLGRAQGSLLDLLAQKKISELEKYNEAAVLGKELNRAYFDTIKKRKPVPEEKQEILQEEYHSNWVVHLVRFIRALVNVEKAPYHETDKEIKLTATKLFLEKAKELGLFAAYPYKSSWSKALFDLGQMYAVEDNDEAAIHFFAEATSRDHKAARSELWVYAHKGLPAAQFRFAQQYIREGKVSAAIRWLFKAAQQRHKDAEEILTKYAEKKNIKAQYFLAEVCRKYQKHTRAMRWFYEAAKQRYGPAKSRLFLYAQEGHQEAQFRLGELSVREGNIPKAIQWFAKAVNKNHRRAHKALLTCAEVGYSEAQYRIGKVWERNQGHLSAIRWYFEAAKNRHVYALSQLCSYGRWHPQAQFYLGWLHLNGLMGKADDNEAFSYFIKAAEQGHIEAQYFAGTACERNKDHENAIGWYVEAVENRHAYALWRLRSYAEWHPEAQYSLGCLHLNGSLGRVDEKQALHCFLEAAAEGHEEAQAYLASLCLEDSLMHAHRLTALQANGIQMQRSPYICH